MDMNLVIVAGKLVDVKSMTSWAAELTVFVEDPEATFGVRGDYILVRTQVDDELRKQLLARDEHTTVWATARVRTLPSEPTKVTLWVVEGGINIK